MSQKILDVFNHYLPPAYYDKITELGGNTHMLTRARNMPAMSDINYRLTLMKRFEGYCQVPCIVSPNVEQVVAPEYTAELARFANEEFRRLCDAYPEFFPSFVAVLPLDDMEKAAFEAEYAVKELGAAGVQIFTNLKGEPIDTPNFFYLYEHLNKLDTALWIHPIRTVNEPYYKNEQHSKYELWWTIMWPVETVMAVSRLVYSGLFQKYPDFKVIIHHGGGFIPMLEGRLENGLKLYSTRTAPNMQHLVESPIQNKCQVDEFRKFYADCATFGSRAAIECALNFYGYDHMVFASDMPFDPEDGSGYIRMAIQDISDMNISSEDKEKLFWKNAAKILKLKF